MAYGIVHFFAGATKEQYDASLAAVHPSGTGLPKGQTFHAAGPSAGGWTVIAIHESKESWERFRDDILMPTLQKGVKGGFVAAPKIRRLRSTTCGRKPPLSLVRSAGTHPRRLMDGNSAHKCAVPVTILFCALSLSP